MFSDLPSSPWWDLVPATLGGIIGALAGGLVAICLAIRATREAKEERIAAKRQADEAKLFRLFTSVAIIANSLMNNILLIRSMYQNSSSQVGQRFPKQALIREIANIDFEEYVSIHPDDVAILYEYDQVEFANDLQNVVNQFNGVLSCLRQFNVAKRETVDLLMLADKHQIGPDGSVTSEINSKHRAKLQLLEARSESIIAPTLVNLIHATNLAINVADRFRDVAKHCLPTGKRFPGFATDEIERLKGELPELSSGL